MRVFGCLPGTIQWEPPPRRLFPAVPGIPGVAQQSPIPRHPPETPRLPAKKGVRDHHRPPDNPISRLHPPPIIDLQNFTLKFPPVATMPSLGKIKPMAIVLPRRNHAFTLIEIVGVVSIIAILAAVLAPRVMNVIGRSKVSSTTQSLASLRSATTAYLAQYPTLPTRAGTGSTNAPVATGRFDADLVRDGYLERYFSSSLGIQTIDASALPGRIHVRCLAAGPTASATTTSSIDSLLSGALSVDSVDSSPTSGTGTVAVASTLQFDLDRNPASTDITSGQMVVHAYIPGVKLADAIELNRLVDGETNSASAGTDAVGRCIYDGLSGGTVTVRIYIAHR